MSKNENQQQFAFDGANVRNAGAAGNEEQQAEYLRSLLSGLQPQKSANESAVTETASTNASTVSAADGSTPASPAVPAAAAAPAATTGTNEDDLSKVLAAWIDEDGGASPKTNEPKTQQASAATVGIGSFSVSSGTSASTAPKNPYVQQQGGIGTTASGPGTPMKYGSGSSANNTSRPVPEPLHDLTSSWGSSRGPGPQHGRGNAGSEYFGTSHSPVDSPSSVGSWSRRSHNTHGHHQQQLQLQQQQQQQQPAGTPTSRDPMLAPSTPSASQPFVPACRDSSMLKSGSHTPTTLPPGMPPVAIFAPFQATNHIVAVINLESKTTQRQLFQIFFPMGATDAVVFSGTSGHHTHRRSGVVLFNSADAASMASEKIDNFVPHGQSQPLTCVYLAKGEQHETQLLQDQQLAQQQAAANSLTQSDVEPSDTTGSGAHTPTNPPHDDCLGNSSVAASTATDDDTMDAKEEEDVDPNRPLGSFQVSSSTGTPNETRLGAGTPPAQAPALPASGAPPATASMSNAFRGAAGLGPANSSGRNFQTPPAAENMGTVRRTPPPTPPKVLIIQPAPAQSRHEGVVPSSRPTARAHTIATLLSARTSISEVYPVLTAAVIGQPHASVKAVVEATISSIHSLLTSPEQQRSCLRSVASLVKHLAEDTDPTMKATFQEPVSRCIMQILLNADEEAAARSTCGVACGYLFDYGFIGGNPFAMSKKLMGRASQDPNIVDALVSLTSSWSSRHAASGTAPTRTDDDLEIEAEFRKMVKTFYEEEGGKKPATSIPDVSLDSTVGSDAAEPAASTAAASSMGVSAAAAPFVPPSSSAPTATAETTGAWGNTSRASTATSLSTSDAQGPSGRPVPTTQHNASSCSVSSTGAANVKETTLQKDLLQSTVYITRIPPGAREDKLRQLFIDYGGEFNKVRLYDETSANSGQHHQHHHQQMQQNISNASQNSSVNSSTANANSANNKNRGAFCFVEFVHPQSARALIRSLNNFPVGDTTLLVSYARSAIHDQDPRDAVFSAEGKVRECLFGLVPGPTATSVTAATGATASAAPMGSAQPRGSTSTGFHSSSAWQQPSSTSSAAGGLGASADEGFTRGGDFGGFTLSSKAANVSNISGSTVSSAGGGRLNASATAFTPGVGWGAGNRGGHKDPQWSQ